jgi:molybdate transport system substrate-binding protein
VTFSFGASSDLARQIKAGAPADVFFSADVARMDDVTQAGLVEPAARRDVLSNQLVIVVPEGSTTAIAGPNDLLHLRHIALANPETVPAGVYARTWLGGLGLWDRLKDTSCRRSTSVRRSRRSKGGHAEAGIVYATDAAISKRVRVAYRVPREQGPPIVYVLARLKNGKRPIADRLAAFLASRDAVPVYERFGFIVLAPN